MGDEIFFSEVELVEQTLPGFSRYGLRVLFAGLGDAGGDFGVGGMREVGGLHLSTKEFLVDETVENGAAIVVSELVESTIAEKSFVAESFVPVGLQNDMTIDGGDDAVDHFGGAALRRKHEYR